jgi:hypothetical protein
MKRIVLLLWSTMLAGAPWARIPGSFWAASDSTGK